MTAPGFALPGIDGEAIRLESLRGKIVLLNFWSTGCGPCIAEMPALIQFQSRHVGKVVVIGINVDSVEDDDAPGPSEDPTPKVVAMARAKGLTYPVIVDRKGAIVGPYDGSGVPLNVLIDSEGKIRRRFVGPRSVEVLEQMLAEFSNP